MTSNFKNSAGTDLDSLFYSDNGNAGALGFLNSSGTDLGNKYTNKTTLGTTIGFKNSAGTDIGNLRGATVPVTGSLTITQATNDWDYKYYSYTDSSGESPTTAYTNLNWHYGQIKGNLTISNSMPITGITYYLQVRKSNSSSGTYIHWFWLINGNTTAPTWPTLSAANETGYVTPVSGFSYNRSSTTSYVSTKNYNGGTTLSYTFTYKIMPAYRNNSTTKPTYFVGNGLIMSNTQARVLAAVTNAAGTTNIYSSAVTLAG